MSTEMTPEQFRHLDPFRVRWAEVDLQKIVFNGHYLMYFDTAVAGYWRALALPYHEAMEVLDGDLYVRKATLEYEGSARYDDLCRTGIRCARIGNSSILFQAAVFRGRQRLVHGELVYVFADPATQTSRPVPPRLREILQGFEAGETMLDLRLGAWAELGTDAAALRRAVFVDELGAPPVVADDADDAGALHVLARNRLGMAVGTARLLPAADGHARIGRMAVPAGLRASGIGGALLDTLVEAARRRGDRALVLSAHEDARHFYARAGFAETGRSADAAGITTVEMLRTL